MRVKDESGTDTMRAAVCRAYGPPSGIRVEEVARPAAGPGEVLVRVEAAGVNAADWRLARGDPALVRLAYGLRRPKHPILGCDVAGTVEAVGEGTDGLAIGDEVLGDLSEHGLGGFAEFAAGPAAAFVKKPEGVPWEAAAAAPGASLAALQALRDAVGLQPGERVLVHGASGGVGSAAVRVAKALGGRVTAVCSAGKVEHARAAGAEVALTYDEPAGGGFDAVVVANSNRPLMRYIDRLRPGGRCVVIGGPGYQFLRVAAASPVVRLLRGRTLVPFFLAQPNPADLQRIAAWLADGTLSPTIDAVEPLERVGAALAALEAGRALGKRVIRPRAG